MQLTRQPSRQIVVDQFEAQSNDERLSVGDYVTGILPWKKINTVNGDDVTPVPSKDVPLHLYLSVLGMPGMTAYTGLMVHLLMAQGSHRLHSLYLSFSMVICL